MPERDPRRFMVTLKMTEKDWSDLVFVAQAQAMRLREIKSTVADEFDQLARRLYNSVKSYEEIKT